MSRFSPGFAIAAVLTFRGVTVHLFPDGDQLQDLHRQLEHPDGGLAQNVSAELGFWGPD